MKAGAPDRIRTCGLQLRRLSLYPAELRAPSNLPSALHPSASSLSAKRVMRPAGLEPAAYWFEASRSIQLSYGRTDQK